MYVTPSRFFVVEEGWNVWDDVVRWWDRVGSGHGEVAVPHVADGREYVAFGNRLASLRADDGAHNRVEPIDLATGDREAPVLTNTEDVRALGDGRLVAVLPDTTNGRLVLLADGGTPTTVAEFEDLGVGVTGLGIGGGKVVMRYGDAWRLQNAQTWTAPVDGSATPQPLTDATGETPGGMVQAAGDTVITFVAEVSHNTDTYRVVWPGGYRDITAFPQSARLGAGGRVIIRSLDGTTLEDARTGAPLGSVPAGRHFAVDGRTLWLVSDDASTLTAHDLDGVTPDRTVRTGLPASCAVSGLQVVERFGLVRCSNSFFSVDTGEVYEPWKVPYLVGASPAAITDIELGPGFATWMHYLTDPDGVTYAVVKAQDLGPGRQLKTYGPGHGLSMPPQPMVAADDRAARLAYVDGSMLVRRVDLDWLTTPATSHEDTSAPRLVTVGGTAQVSAGPIRATWSFTDDDPSIEYGSGIADYDVRYQQRAVGQPVLDGGWLTPPSLSGLTSTSVDLPGTSGKDTCWSVRARDRVGNVSGWTAPRCTTLDVTGPTVRITPLPAVTTASAVAIAYAGSDPAGVASYDVRYRHATYGGTFSGYFTAASATTVTRFAVTLAARTQYCYSARARDNVGNVSAWSAETCVSTVLDDRDLTRNSPAWVTGTNKAYYRSTVTSTTKPGVSLTAAGMKARQVFVLTTTCRTCGSVAVYVGATKVGTISTYSSTTKARVWLSTPLTTARTGTVKFVSTTTGKTIIIDAFTVRSW